MAAESIEAHHFVGRAHAVFSCRDHQHRRFSFEDGKLAEHWDVIQEEATQAESGDPRHRADEG